MYSENFQKSLAAVEAAREKNIALEPERMTAKQKEDLLAAYHPDYKQEEFAVLEIGPNKGDKVPVELAEMLQAHSRIGADSVDLSNPDYDVDVLVIGGGGAGSSAAKQPLRAEDVQIKPTEHGLAHPIILDGRINTNHLRMIGKNERWLEKECASRGLRPQDVFLMTADDVGEITIYPKEKKK